MDATTNRQGLRTGALFATVLLIFGLTFAGGVGLLALDQQRVLTATDRLHQDTIPKMVRYQRLARNLEQLRQEGDFIFSATSPEAKRQALFMVTLIASHPSVVEHPTAVELARQSEKLLATALKSPEQLNENKEAWHQLSTRLVLLADEIFSEGVHLTADDIKDVATTMGDTRQKLFIALPLFMVACLTLIGLIHHLLMRPLRRIDRTLSHLNAHEGPPALPASPLLEINSVNAAVVQLHELIVQNEANRKKLEAQAHHDDLTGLDNRRRFMQKAEAEIRRCQRHHRPISVALADIDNFKKINDTYGHAAGDEVLRQFAHTLQQGLRETDLLGRYGGEEFAFVFPETAPEEARRLADRLLEHLRTLTIPLGNGQDATVTLSIGIACADERNLEAALKHADDALYQAKAQGRDQTVADAIA